MDDEAARLKRYRDAYKALQKAHVPGTAEFDASLCDRLGVTVREAYDLRSLAFGLDAIDDATLDAIELSVEALRQEKQAPAPVATTKRATSPETRDDATTALADAVRAIASSAKGVDEAAVETIARRVMAESGGSRTVHVTFNGAPSVRVDGPMPVWFDVVLRKVRAGVPTLLVGPAGCGKSHVARSVAQALGLRFEYLACTAGMSEFKLVGRYVPAGEGGAWVYVGSRLLDFYENGGMYCLDELDAADANVLLVVNEAIANGHLSVPDRSEAPVAARHADFRLVACANTFGQGATATYTGRSRLDASTVRRFRPGIVTCDYDPDVERNIVDRDVLAWALPMRERLKARGIEHRLTDLSTGCLVGFSTLKAYGEKPVDWETSLMAGWTDEEKKVARGK